MNKTIPIVTFTDTEPKTTPLMPTALGTPNGVNQRAEALAQVRQMHDDLTDAQAIIGQLKADLHREQDRCVMMVEERDKYRADADLLRNQLLKVCTTVANIGLLTKEAEAVVLTVNEHAAKD
jgi:uncharacterized coiled-coil DUF342 family protein